VLETCSPGNQTSRADMPFADHHPCNRRSSSSPDEVPARSSVNAHLADMDVQSPKAPSWFCLRLDVYPPPQVLQTNGCFCHSPLPSFLLESLHHSRASSLHGHYPASLLLLTPPPPSRRPPLSRCRRLYSFLLRGFSPRDEEGFSSCLLCPCHRAVATAPPERLAASVSLQRSMLPSPRHVRFGLWVFWVSR
jgi:hypothetical protein